MQTALNALADLEAYVVITTSVAISPADLTIPANAHVVRYADHNAILARANLCVTHGGHGTVMRAFEFGVPRVVIPGFLHDQAPNAAMVEKMGVRLALPSDADKRALKKAAKQIPDDASFKNRSKAHANIVRHLDGTSAAADVFQSSHSLNTTTAVS